MAFTVTTRALLVAAVALAAVTSPANAVDFSTTDTATTDVAKVATADTSASGGAAPATAPAAAPVTAPATTTKTPAKTPASAATTPSAASAASATGGSAPADTSGTTSSIPTAVKKTVDGWPAPIVIKGNKFFDSKSKLEFRMKGMAYYPRPNAGELANVNNYDWIADEHEAVWGPHLAVMQDLGVNVVRIYSVDPGKSHDKFMCAAASAGIYVLIGMAAPCENCAILDQLPPKCYPDELFQRMQVVYNAFAVYDNVLGFSVGNENNLLRTFEKTGIQTMPCAKALLRDTRNYAASCSGALRQVPIGLDLADILPRDQWLSYMDCAVDNNEFTRAEWLGFNPYVECNQAANKEYSQSAGLQNLMSVYKNIQYPRPLMFGEFGCNLGKNTMDGYENQRMFYDAKWMNEEPDMMEEIVGGNVFEFVTEIPNTVAKKLTKVADNGRYGVGYFSPDTCDHEKVPCKFTPYPEYANLKKAYTSTKAPTLKLDDYKVAREKVLTCPSNISSTLQPMPTSIKPLTCRNDPTTMPKCNGVVSNGGTKAKNPPTLGATTAPSNTNPSGGGGSSGNSTSAAAPVHGSSFATAAVAAVFSVVASLVLV